MHNFITLEVGKIYKFRAEIDYQKKSKYLSVKYYLDYEFILQHYYVPISSKKTDGPYGPNKPYIKIGIYRIGDTGTTTYNYNNHLIAFEDKSVGRPQDDSKPELVLHKIRAKHTILANGYILLHIL